jgi:hypothetical protein
VVLKARMNAQTRNLAEEMEDMRHQKEVATASSVGKAVWKAAESDVERVEAEVEIGLENQNAGVRVPTAKALREHCLSNDATADDSTCMHMMHHLNV